MLLSCFMSNLFPLIASLKTTRARAQRNYDESAAHGIWCLFHTKGVMAHSIWVFSNVKTGKGEKKKTLQKDKQRLHFKKTAVAGSGCVLPYSFRNNKHRLLTGRRRGGTAATHARLGRAKDLWRRAGGGSGRRLLKINISPEMNAVFFSLPLSLSFFFCVIILTTTGLFLFLGVSRALLAGASFRGYSITFSHPRRCRRANISYVYLHNIKKSVFFFLICIFNQA